MYGHLELVRLSTRTVLAKCLHWSRVAFGETSAQAPLSTSTLRGCLSLDSLAQRDPRSESSLKSFRKLDEQCGLEVASP